MQTIIYVLSIYAAFTTFVSIIFSFRDSNNQKTIGYLKQQLVKLDSELDVSVNKHCDKILFLEAAYQKAIQNMWIEFYLQRNNNEVDGLCQEAVTEMNKFFPSLKPVKGFVYDDKKGVTIHYWLINEAGNIIDPTAIQFDKIRKYVTDEQFNATNNVIRSVNLEKI